MKNNRIYKKSLMSGLGVCIFVLLSVAIFFSPATTFACNKPTDIGSTFDYSSCVINTSIVPFIIGLGVLIFLIGIVRYVAAGDNEEKRSEGRGFIIFGIIVVFVMVSVWGLVNILVSTFNLNNSYPGSSQTTTGPGVDVPSGPSTETNPVG